jgi:hypothetical protein
MFVSFVSFSFSFSFLNIPESTFLFRLYQSIPFFIHMGGSERFSASMDSGKFWGISFSRYKMILGTGQRRWSYLIIYKG